MAIEIDFDAEVYDLAVIKGAAYRLAKYLTIDISVGEGRFFCTLQANVQSDGDAMEALVQRFKLEVLDQDLRQQIYRRTSHIREAVLAVAFAPYTKI